MNTISRYLVQEFLKVVALCLVSFIAIYLIVDFFERVDNFLEAHVSVWILGRYMLLQIPFLLQLMLPASVLIGSIISVGLIARNREIIVLMTGGLSMGRLFVPYLLAALCLASVQFFVADTLLPAANRKANYIWKVQVQKRPPNTLYRKERFWYRGNGIIYHITNYDAASKTLENVTMYLFGEPFGLKERIDAQEARWSDGAWLLWDGLKQERLPDNTVRSERFDSLRLHLNERPEDFTHMRPNPSEMTFRELQATIGKMMHEGYDVSEFETDLQAKLAVPFACVIMVLIGFPLALRKKGRSALAVGVGLGMGIAFVYWVLQSFSISVGHSGALPPAFAAWVANLTFLVLGIAVFSQVAR